MRRPSSSCEPWLSMWRPGGERAMSVLRTNTLQLEKVEKKK